LKLKAGALRGKIMRIADSSGMKAKKEKASCYVCAGDPSANENQQFVHALC
jgi:hypothetical protein